VAAVAQPVGETGSARLAGRERIRRVAIVGCAGAGKSTFARRLAPLTGLPLVHLDRLFWGPGWVPTERPAWRAKVEALVAEPSWILDGNYKSNMDLRIAAADLVLFFDLPRTLCIWRVVKRSTVYRGRNRPDLPAGCPERLELDFLRWIWSYPAVLRPIVLARLAEAPPGSAVIRFRRSAEAEAFLAAVSQDGLETAVAGWPSAERA
jgi:adenylate kinase family enzyme